jgi:hypothetical protein
VAGTASKTEEAKSALPSIAKPEVESKSTLPSLAKP